MSIGCVAVANETVRRFIPREGFGDLADDPLRRWVGGYTYQPPAFVPEDGQNEEQSKAHRRHDQEVHSRSACGMVLQEGLPGLRPPSPTPRHVLGDRRLSDVNPELEQF